MRRSKKQLELYFMAQFITLFHFKPDRPQYKWIEDFINEEIKEHGYNGTVAINTPPKVGDVLEVRLDNNYIIGPFIIKE